MLEKPAEICGRGVTYRDGDFSSRAYHEFCWIDTVGDQGSRFLTTSQESLLIKPVWLSLAPIMKNSSRSHYGDFILEVYIGNQKGGDPIMVSFIEVFLLASIFGVLYAMLQLFSR
jgi:hypothetical protein